MDAESWWWGGVLMPRVCAWVLLVGSLWAAKRSMNEALRREVLRAGIEETQAAVLARRHVMEAREEHEEVVVAEAAARSKEANAKRGARREPDMSLLGTDAFGVRFDAAETFPPEHLRLNAFAGVKGLDFHRDVLPRLNADQQKTALRFFAKVAESLERDCPVDKTRFYQFPDEFTMLRFLQADVYNEDKALDRIRTSLKWRQTVGLDDFISDPDWKLINRYRKLRIRVAVGLDKNGRPLGVERLGEFFASDEAFKGGMSLAQWVLCYSFDSSEALAYTRRSTELTGVYNHKINYIADLRGVKLSKLSGVISNMRVVTKNIEINFPEVAGQITITHAPSFAVHSWNLAKSFLDPEFAAKVTLFAGSAHEQLLRRFGAVVLPEEYGGSNPLTIPRIVTKVDKQFERDFPLR